ncbi:unnamed protein product [Candidula unifasciata]|uniref:C1q domain-containing protein n=1 Tax=Candidula unifasciata TaxID=100452 RepID=A0A8S3ZP96_9EUPU|nr:unnamed protein product [Candidula unifasciata]
MGLLMERLCLQGILLLLLYTRVVSSEDVVGVSPPDTEGSLPANETDTVRDCSAEISIKEMMAKLEAVVTPRGFCSNQDGVEPPKPCIDLTSSQSVVTQLCDRLSALDTKVNGLAAKVNLRSAPNHNSNDHDKPFTQIAKLKEEIKRIKRSAVFYAIRTDKIGNFTDQRISNYNATVNSGPYFDPANGIFLAPFEGIYHFSLSYQKSPEVNLEANLIVDDSVIASTSEEQRQKIDLLTSLKPGQEVWTGITNNNSPTDSEVSIVFSGYFLH